MRTRVLLLVLLVACTGWPRTPAAAAEAIALPTAGEMKIAKMTSSAAAVLQTIITVVAGVPVPVPLTTHLEGEVAMHVAGLPAKAPLSAFVSATSFVVATGIQTKVEPSVLRTPAGEVPLDVSLDVKPPIVGGKTRITYRLHGANGTGLFDSVRVVGALQGEEGTPSRTTISLTGTVFLGFASVEQARSAAERGLAANPTLTDQDRAQLLEHVTAALAQAQAGDFPADVAAAPGSPAGGARAIGPPPERPVVEHTVRRDGERLRVSLRIIVPAGDAKQAVRVVTVGAEGTHTVYEAAHAPGEIVQLEVEGADPLIIQVYVAGRTAAEIHPQ